MACPYCPDSKATISILVGTTGPLGQGPFQRTQILDVERLHAPDRRHAVGTDIPYDEVAWSDMQRGADFLGDRCLALGSDLGNGNHGAS